MIGINTLERQLKEWKEQPVETVLLSAIRKLPALQPRNALACDRRDAYLDEKQSEIQIVRMTQWLRTHKDEMEPVLLTRDGKKLYIVDGHHRCAAYRRANRLSIPARIREVPPENAMFVAAVANLQGEKRVLVTGQRSEAAWQWIIAASQGSDSLPSGTSMRDVANLYGVGVGTIHRMVARLSSVRAARAAHSRAYRPEECNALSGWPLWRYARTERDDAGSVDADAKRQARVVSLAARLSNLIDREGKDVFLDACAMIGDDIAEASRVAADEANELLYE